MLTKQILSVLLTFALATIGLTEKVAGQEMEGEIRYLVTHNWTKKMASLDYISKQRRERVAYMWGRSFRVESLYHAILFSNREQIQRIRRKRKSGIKRVFRTQRCVLSQTRL